MKENFKAAIDFVMAHECVFAHGHQGDYAHVIAENVSGDRGGLTKFGIDQRSHPHVDIKALDYLGAVRIYRDEEWTKIRGDDLPAGYDIAVFDTAVNCGCGTAALLLQRACNLCRARPYIEDFEGLKTDGFIGPKTIRATELCRTDGLDEFLSLRVDHYQNLIEENPRLVKFERGWVNRSEDLAIAITGRNGTGALA